MSFSPADSAIYGRLFSGSGVSRTFGDEQLLERMIEFEAALARVEGRLGVIPTEAADRIDKLLNGVRAEELDIESIAQGTERDGVPLPALLSQLRHLLGEADAGRGENSRGSTPVAAAEYLHWGATSQDVVDTALALQLREALGPLEAWLGETAQGLADLARRHRDTPMVGRTHGRQAVPITFGLKAAGWLAPLLRHQERLVQAKPRVLLLQLGGAAGTLAPLGDKGPAVRRELARELKLGLSAGAWHTQRDGLAELASWLSGVCISLAKVAQDVILLSSEEVGEVTTAGTGGGSSTMPQKSNPIDCEMIVASARACSGLLATVHSAGIQEHERGTHGWQLEWTTLPQMIAYASSALEKSARLVSQLEADEGRMLANLESGGGLALAESLSFELAKHVPRSEAKRLVKEAVSHVLGAARASGSRPAAGEAPGERLHLVDALRACSSVDLDWQQLKEPARALGSAGSFVDEVLALAARQQGEAGQARATVTDATGAKEHGAGAGRARRGEK